ncbi:MAG: TetR/AcrR family transcriptional regulator [Pseudomonadales bacterium]|nr:TetR/AcrR family transcriptional regulator [Pseudomonadales bacterium]
MASIDNNDALVNRVLDLSLDAVSRSGLDGFSIRNIASEAGCSVTPISRRFETKADLLLAVQNHAYGEELKFHRNLAAELESMPLSYENLVEVLILYIEKRTKFKTARFWSEVLLKLEPGAFSRDLLRHWHQMRVKFWSDRLKGTERSFSSALPELIVTYITMEELFAYQLWPNIHYRMLLQENVRALLAGSFGIQDNAVEGDVFLWLNSGGEAFPEFDKHPPDDLAEKLLEIAADEIKEKGLGSLSQRRLTKKAGVSSAMIAYHFDNMANFVNEALWHALLREKPSEFNAKDLNSIKQKNKVEWARVLKRLTRPKTGNTKAGFYSDYAKLTGQACLLASRQESLYPLIEHLRRIGGWGTFKSGQTFWPDSLVVKRGTASVFAVWMKGQAILNEALSDSGMIPEEMFFSAAELLFEQV